MKNCKKMMALLLALAMLVTMCPLCGTTLAATDDNHKEYQCVVSLGDSIPVGYGQDAEKAFGFTRVDHSYPAVVADRLEAELIPLAFVAFRTKEMRYMLEDDYTGDEFMFKVPEARFQLWKDELGLGQYDTIADWMDAYKQTYREGIAKGDLILLSVGVNDVLTYTILKIRQALAAETDNPEILQQAEELFSQCESLSELVEGLVSVFEKINDAGQLVATVIQALNDGYESLITNFPIVYQEIRELNPTADIVVTGAYNYAEDLQLTSDDSLGIGRALILITEKINEFFDTGFSESDDYTYVDINGVEYYGLVPVDDPTFQDCMIINVHPTIAGHKDIADRIFNALPEAEGMAFRDVSTGDWYYSSLKSACEAGVLEESETFNPTGDMTRGEFAEMLWKLAGSPKVTGKLKYTDCRSGVNQEAILWVTKNKILPATSLLRFSPGVALKRSELLHAVSVYNLQQNLSIRAVTKVVSAYSAAGFVGLRNKTYRLNGTVTRAEGIYAIGKLAEA